MTDIEKAIEALAAAFASERARLPTTRKDAEKAEKRLLKLCSKATGAIEHERRRIYRHRQDRKWEEEEPARQERARQDELKRQVFDAGYRTMATKLHPDVGGSHDAMLRLNEMRDKLKRAWR
jgi:hypothetical protein